MDSSRVESSRVNSTQVMRSSESGCHMQRSSKRAKARSRHARQRASRCCTHRPRKAARCRPPSARATRRLQLALPNSLCSAPSALLCVVPHAHSHSLSSLNPCVGPLKQIVTLLPLQTGAQKAVASDASARLGGAVRTERSGRAHESVMHISDGNTATNTECRVPRWWCTLTGKSCADAMELTATMTRRRRSSPEAAKGARARSHYAPRFALRGRKKLPSSRGGPTRKI